jgi:hypothetical protein
MSHVIGTWAVSLCIDTDLLSEATMANELSRRRCDVRKGTTLIIARIP